MIEGYRPRLGGVQFPATSSHPSAGEGEALTPAVKRRVVLTHGNEEASAGRRDFARHFDKRFDRRPIGLSREHMGADE